MYYGAHQDSLTGQGGGEDGVEGGGEMELAGQKSGCNEGKILSVGAAEAASSGFCNRLYMQQTVARHHLTHCASACTGAEIIY